MLEQPRAHPCAQIQAPRDLSRRKSPHFCRRHPIDVRLAAGRVCPVCLWGMLITWGCVINSVPQPHPINTAAGSRRAAISITGRSVKAVCVESCAVDRNDGLRTSLGMAASQCFL